MSLPDPNILVVLTSARGEFEGNAIIAALQAQGIAAKLFGQSASTLQWQGGYTDPYKVMVRRADAPAALGIIKSLKSEASDIDWSKVDVHEEAQYIAPGLVCWACGQVLGGLPATQLKCPKCESEIFADEATSDDSAADAREYPKGAFLYRWRSIRRVGWVLVAIAVPILVSPIFALPVLAIVLISFGMSQISRRSNKP